MIFPSQFYAVRTNQMIGVAYSFCVILSYDRIIQLLESTYSYQHIMSQKFSVILGKSCTDL
jgi:hypothetical protein